MNSKLKIFRTKALWWLIKPAKFKIKVSKYWKSIFLKKKSAKLKKKIYLSKYKSSLFIIKIDNPAKK